MTTFSLCLWKREISSSYWSESDPPSWCCSLRLLLKTGQTKFISLLSQIVIIYYFQFHHLMVIFFNKNIDFLMMPKCTGEFKNKKSERVCVCVYAQYTCVHHSVYVCVTVCIHHYMCMCVNTESECVHMRPCVQHHTIFFLMYTLITKNKLSDYLILKLKLKHLFLL